MSNPYTTGYAPVVGLGGVPTGISNLLMGSTRYVPVNATPTPVYPVLPKVQFQVPIEQPASKPDLSRRNAVPGSAESDRLATAIARSFEDKKAQRRQSPNSLPKVVIRELSPPPQKEGNQSSYGGFEIGETVVRKNQPCTLLDIDFSTSPPDAIIQMRNGRKITTEFEQLSKPKKNVYEGFAEGD